MITRAESAAGRTTKVGMAFVRAATVLCVLTLSSAGACCWAQASGAFVHPGAVNGRAELDRVKEEIRTTPGLWSARGKFGALYELATPYAKSRAPGSSRADEEDAKHDARKAYANALAWYYTEDPRYARHAMAVLGVWAKTFTGYAVEPGVSSQSQLNAGWIGALMGSAAEVLSGYKGWTDEQRAEVRQLFATRFYPALSQESGWNGNVDLTQIDALINIAVFNENRAWFDEAKARLKRRNPRFFYLPTDVGVNRTDPSWFSPTRWVAGLTQETCRTHARPPNDNGHHTQYALASALRAAEVAWNQGDESIYDENKDRYVAAMELLAKQVSTGDMQGTCADPVATKSLFDTWAIGYNHYHRRRGIQLPHTHALLVSTARPKRSDWNIFFESLTHGSPAP
jgi:hypothetical protein